MDSASNGHDDLIPVNFGHPPVVEVACTVQFAKPLIDDQSVLNSFWPRVRTSYPNLQAQPALPPMREEFGPGPALSFQMLGGMGNLPQRYWLLSDGQEELIQIQADRFAFNWRKEPIPGGPVYEYPRYPHVRERFRDALAELLEEGRSREVVALPEWCEIAYINHVPAIVDGHKRPLASILRFVNDLPLSFLEETEDSAFVQRYLLSRDGFPYGRFHINAHAAFLLPAQELRYVLTLTVRGRVAGESEDDVLRFMDHGRDLIVHAFRDATTSEMHDEWGLQ